MSCLIKQMNDFIKTNFLAKFVYFLIKLFENTAETLKNFCSTNNTCGYYSENLH